MKTKQILFKKVLVVLSSLSVILLLAVSFLFPNMVSHYECIAHQTVPYSLAIFLWITCIPLFAILICFLKLSLSLYKNVIFEDKTIKRIRMVQFCSFVEIGLYIYAVLTYHSLLSIVVLAATILVFLFASIVREILTEGKEYYEDSSLSI